MTIRTREQLADAAEKSGKWTVDRMTCGRGEALHVVIHRAKSGLTIYPNGQIMRRDVLLHLQTPMTVAEAVSYLKLKG